MSAQHLDQSTLEAMLADPNAHRELVAHLEAGCDTCDAFLESSGPDALDGLADALLLNAAGAREAPLDEVGYRRVKRGLAGPRRLYAGLSLAAALALGIAGVLFLRAPPPDDGGIKSASPGQLVLELSAAARARDGSVQRVADGSRLRSTDLILLRAHTSEAGVASLWLQRGKQEPRLLGQVPLEAGTHDLKLGGDFAGISLDGEAGPLTVWVVASREPTPVVSPAEALARVDSGESRDVAVGRLVVTVEP